MIDLRSDTVTKPTEAMLDAMQSKKMRQQGVLVGAWSASDLRFVTHHHIGAAEIDRAIEAFARVWTGA